MDLAHFGGLVNRGHVEHTRLDKRPLEIAFPGLFIAVLRLLAALPQSLQLALGKRMARPDTEESS